MNPGHLSPLSPDPHECAAQTLSDHAYPSTIINPFDIADRMGLGVAHIDFGDTTVSEIAQYGEHDVDMFVSRRDSEPLQRYECARLLGHYVFRNHHADAGEYAFTSKRQSPVSTEETFAETFALALLVPEAMLAQEVDKSVEHLAARYQITPKHAQARLERQPEHTSGLAA